MITREEAYEILRKYMKGENYLTHSYAVEAIMRGLAKKPAPDEVEFWGICGLLHDLDEEQCDWQNDMSVHGPTSVEILKKEGVDDERLFNTILSHNPANGYSASDTIEYAMIAADPMSGFVRAVTLVYPDKKLSSVKIKSIKKRFKEPKFAAGANRDFMMMIEKTGIEFPEFCQIAYDSMLEISDKIGL